MTEIKKTHCMCEMGVLTPEDGEPDKCWLCNGAGELPLEKQWRREVWETISALSAGAIDSKEGAETFIDIEMSKSKRANVPDQDMVTLAFYICNALIE